jgi:CSLREA domain-containing protein
LLTPVDDCLVVTVLSDELDAAPGDGICDTNPNTEGLQCTLRAAIEEANALDGKQCITFDIRDGTGEPVVNPVIKPFSALPAITDSLSINGTTQPGSDRVRIEGASAGSKADGLVIQQAHDVSLKGLAFYDFDGNGVAIIGGSDHLIEDTFVGWDGSTPRPNGAAGIHVSGGATDVTIGSLEDALINHIADGIRIEGEDTRKIKVLRNALEVPADWINAESVRLPIDLGDEGPMCAKWEGPAEGAPNDAMPSPRILDLAGSFVNGKTVAGSTVIVYRVHDTGSGLSRYWPRMMHPVAHGEAGSGGLFTIGLDLPVGAKVSLVAIDPEGNTSEPTQLRRPVIVLPGIGGTWLRDQNATSLWLPMALTSDEKNARMRRLAMESNGDTGQESLVATDVIESVLGSTRGYGALHERLESAGFPGHVQNQTPSEIDQWRFPNDWRRSADKLADILSGMIDVLTVDSGALNGAARSCQVDLVAHSNGGLIASVYVRRDHDKAQDRVHRLVSSGTPYLGATQAVAAHTRGYIFDVDDSLLGTGWDVAWGDMTVMTRNVAGAYGLMPSKAYYKAVDPSSASHAHGFTVVDLYNDGLSAYDAVLDMLTRPKVDENNVPFGFARNASVWNLQQTKVHDKTNDWRDFEGPPQIFRQVGRLVGSTATGWSLRPGPHFLAPGSTTRSEPDDTDRHRAYRERLDAIKGLGDGTVPLVSATLGRDPYVGREDFSGVDQSRWINDFEYFRCTHTGLVESGCKAIVSGPEALPRIVDILKSGHEVRVAPSSRPAADEVPLAASLRSEAEQSTEDEVEIFYTWSSAPALVMIEDDEGRRTGPTEPELPGAIEYSIPGITYRASRLGASFSLPADGAYSITLTAAAPDARVYLIRQRAGLESLTQILYPDQVLGAGGKLTFTLTAGGTPESAPWQLDADGDGTPESEIPPAAILAGTSSMPALPVPQPYAFDVGIPTGGDPVVRALRIPDTGTEGWSYALTGGAPWLSLSASGGAAPTEIELEFDADGLPEGPISTSLALTLTNEGYETTLEVPVTLHVGITVSTGPDMPEGLPDQLTILPSYPNPTRGEAIIRYGLPVQALARIEVFDMLGRRVSVLVNEQQAAGWHEVVFDSAALPGGLYVVRTHANGAVHSQRLTVVK